RTGAGASAWTGSSRSYSTCRTSGRRSCSRGIAPGSCGDGSGKQGFCSRLADSLLHVLRGQGMKEFKVFVADKTGELARVTEALAGAAVNIRAIASESKHDNSFLRVVTSDVQTTEKALSLAGLKFELND